MFSVAMAAFFLAFLIPLFLHLGELALSVQVLLLIIALPMVLGTFMLLSAAVRPGSVGRFFTKRRRPRV